MIDEYISGSAAQLVERSRKLIALIPRDLPRIYDGLSHRCRQEIAAALAALRLVSEDQTLLAPQNRSTRLRAFRRIVGDLDSLESTGIAALSRAHSDDHRLNQLVARIASEIRYPLPAPTCTTLSHDYFYINPQLGLMFLPLAEGHFSLHLPDIYHELAHPLLIPQHDPLIEPFQDQYAQAIALCLQYTRSEISRLERGKSPEGSRIALRAWESSWVRGWMAEFFCDLFAVFTVGPAFAWSHLHLSLKRGGDPFQVPAYSASSHPPDNARMSVLLNGLQLCGFANEASRIQEMWRSCISRVCYKSQPDYHVCFPKGLLSRIAEMAFIGAKDININLVTLGDVKTVASKLNKAWELFWQDPAQFSVREKALMTEIFEG